jgi:ribosomal protein S27E
MSRPTGDAAPSAEGPSGPLTILLACPQCGAPSAVDDDTRTSVCGHCASFLVVDRPGRSEIFLAETVVDDAEDVRRIVIAYRLQAHRAEILARRREGAGDDARVDLSEIFLEGELRRFEEALYQKVRVVEAHRIEAPYWHFSGTILQAILGRQGDGPKEVRVRGFAVEHTVPGYDTRGANLRDRGLRLARARVHPCSEKARTGRGPFLPWVDVPEAAHVEVGKWRTRDLDPGTEPVVKRGDLTFARRFLVYRVYWLARVVVSDGEQAWVLVDAGFGTIGGYPGEAEARDVLASAVADPDEAESRQTKAYAHPSRCPDCGFEAVFAQRTLVAVCRNCRLAVEPRASGIRNVPYDHAAPSWDGPAEYLPFWAFPLKLRVPAGAAPIDGLESYARMLFPQGAPPGFTVAGDHLFVPAVRLLGTEDGDECFQRLVHWVHCAPPRIETGKVPLGDEASFRDATVTEDEARETLPALLYAIHGRPSAARLSTLLVKRLVDGARIDAGPGKLLFVPFVPTDAGVVAPDGTAAVSRALLDCGPEIEARRVTVFRPTGPERPA